MPENIPSPGRLGGDNRGWGMFFIAQMVDEVEISKLPNGGNQVKMTIYLRSPDQPKDAP
jgi:anti-sigma regulatory factor (Ser/Thr protein kinase)